MGLAPSIQAAGPASQSRRVSLVQSARSGSAGLRPGKQGPGGVAASQGRAIEPGTALPAQQSPTGPAPDAWPDQGGAGSAGRSATRPWPLLPSIPASVSSGSGKLRRSGSGPGGTNTDPERGQDAVDI